MIGQTISHYKILEKLGEGGMGVVFKAEDTKLDRLVALKFLPKGLTDVGANGDSPAERFHHEAKAAAALDHTNICAVYEIDETEDGQLFIVMAYYEGETLKEKIEKGPLKLDETIDIAIQVAEGLNKAHKQDVIHRDIKSANIIITADGVAKILDFGLAKLKGQTKLTKEGTTLGTVAYMSPEQAKGREVDHRSDIWSLGVVLYEMITGQFPYKGDYEQAIMYSIMNDEPEPVTGLRTGVSLDLERIINKTLAKNPSERYQGAVDLLVDLKKLRRDFKPEISTSNEGTRHKTTAKISRKITILGTFMLVAIIIVGVFLLFKEAQKRESSSAAETIQKKIAVLPFTDMSPKKDQGWFCDGIAEELINRLTKTPGFQVTARASSFSFKGKNLDIQGIGQKLKVDILLDGSVRKVENKLRISAQLINVSDSQQIWSETYNREMKDVLEIQDEISQSVLDKLGVSQSAEEYNKLKTGQTKNIEAYSLYLRGNDYCLHYNVEDNLRMGIEMYEKAIELDPNFALAYIALSNTYLHLYWHRFDLSESSLEKARDAVDKAFKISPDLAEAYLTLGHYYYHGHRDYEKALEQCKKAEKRLKSDPDLIALKAFIWRRQGKFEQAAENLRRAADMDPLNSMKFNELAATYIIMRCYKKAEPYLNRAIHLSPKHCELYEMKMNLFIRSGGYIEKAFKVLKQIPNALCLSQNPDVILGAVTLHLLDRKYKRALNQLSLVTPDSLSLHELFLPKDLLFAQIHGLLNEPELERKYYNSARLMLENKLKQHQRDPRIHGSLSLAYAGLDRKREAIREAKLAVELMPIAKDTFIGPIYIINLARVYTMVGEYDLAIGQLEYVLSIHAQISVPSIRLNPVWDPLRTHPRFQKLIKKE